MEKRKMIVKRFVPLLILIILIPVISFMMYPMINMQPRDLHVGIVNKDKGAEFEQGTVNLGGKILEKITDPEENADNNGNEESPVIWEVYASEDAAKQALKKKQIYGYLVIPRNFSSKQTQTLTAFENLSTALGNMSEGTGKMGDGINQMSGKLTQLPTAFRKMGTAAATLGSAAEGLQKPVEMIDAESDAISNAAQNINDNDAAVQQYIAEAEAALSGEEPNIETAQQALQNAKATSEADVEVILKNSGMISAQSDAVTKGLGTIQQAEDGMSSNFNKMADKMGGVKNISQLSSALGALSDGLGEMSGNMEEKVTDAIDTLNGTQETDEDSIVKLYFHVDQSRNVMVTSTLSSMMNGLAANTGLSIETKYENKIPDELNNFYFAMVFMMLVMFTSMIPGILTGFLTRPSAESRITAKTKTTAGQIILIGVIAVCLGFIIPRAIAWMGGFDLPVERLTPFLMICCFSMMMLIVGAVDLIGRPGVIVPVLIMICGTAVANLPYEYLPAFWQKYVFPWEPLRFIAEGVREIIYRGGDWFNQYAQNMLWLVAIGAAFMILSVLKRGKKDAVSE